MKYRKPNPMRDTLRQAGINTDHFLSLRIDKSRLPENAELVVELRDKRTGQLLQVDLNSPLSPLGSRSRFYGQIMADGHIYNPYIHRRFIAAQFRELHRTFGIDGIEHGVAQRYDWAYAIALLRKEVHTLALLEARDKPGFEERRSFFTLNAVQSILEDYVRQVKLHVDRLAARRQGESIFVEGEGRIACQNLRPFKHRFDVLLMRVRECCTYQTLDKTLEAFRDVPLPEDTPLPASFIQPFVEADAYYTLKHAVMFEHKQLGMDQRGSLRLLLQTAQRGSRGACMRLYRQYA